MNYETELRLLCETLRKAHVRTQIVAPNELEPLLADGGIESALGIREGQRALPRRFPRILSPRTMYKVTDVFGFAYIALLLPDPQDLRALCVGPYLMALPSPEWLLEMGEKNGVPPKQQRYFEEYYQGTPVLPEGDRLFLLLDTFCEHVWESPSFSIVDGNREGSLPASPITDNTQSDSLGETTVNVKAMENRYRFENELMQAVSLGQIHKEKQLLAAFSENAFERRLADPLRNAKNYGIIMNTLLRKAAERGGVHPVYLDRISSRIAQQIEQMASLEQNTELMCSIFRSYCRLVRNHSSKQYSPVVQKTVLLIDSDLSASLTLGSLAREQNVSPGYLSSIFKRDTGRTVSEYIRQRRMQHAAHLLATTNLQIQTVALHCGILDVQYFSKTFKRTMGETPKEYREAVRQRRNE